MALPSNIAKRGLSIDEAAEYCGVSSNTLLRHGPQPIKIGDRSIYDRRGLDRWLDELAGLATPTFGAAPADTPEETLLEAIHARKAALRHAPS
jgi:hypothetical protein